MPNVQEPDDIVLFQILTEADDDFHLSDDKSAEKSSQSHAHTDIDRGPDAKRSGTPSFTVVSTQNPPKSTSTELIGGNSPQLQQDDSNDDYPLISSSHITVAYDTESAPTEGPPSKVRSKKITEEQIERIPAAISFRRSAPVHLDVYERRIQRLIAEGETKNIHYQARLIGPHFAPHLPWFPEDLEGILAEIDPRPSCLMVIRCDFQPLNGQIKFRSATITATVADSNSAFSSPIPTSTSQMCRNPMIVMYSPTKLQELTSRRHKSTQSSLGLSASLSAATVSPGINPILQGSGKIDILNETEVTGGRSVRGSPRGDPVNTVVWTIGEDTIAKDGILDIYHLGLLVLCSDCQKPFSISFKMEATTNVRWGKVRVSSKPVTVFFIPRFSDDHTYSITGKDSDAFQPSCVEPAQVSYEINGKAYKSNAIPNFNREQMLHVLKALSKEEAQIRLDKLTIPF